ncbi:MAG TPA: MBL fold metallo-hydrolase [Clostridia bacterium]|nr:MBL fold metallo-hydrolase [Clostridia bacterium]
MARFCPLFSSSSGNCVYIGTGENGILIDIGRSNRQTEKALSEIGVDPKKISAVFITHEHSDHIAGLEVFTKKHKVPVYSSAGTLMSLKNNGMFNCGQITQTVDFSGTSVSDMLIVPFKISHDAKEPLGFVIHMPDSRKIAVVTDTGVITQDILAAISGCDLLYIESNHDEVMLKAGAYPYQLKKRILSDRGHLSNDDCDTVLAELIDKGTTRFVLAHLSRENNLPSLAFDGAESALLKVGARINRDYLLSVAEPINNMKPIIF